jgi:putative FmdB family regulatory protein
VPTYQYACTECGERLEAVQSFSDPALTDCPACTGRLRKVFSAVGVVFKGSGFYKTDSRSSGKGDSGKGDSGKGDSGKGDSGKGDSAGASSSGDASSSSSAAASSESSSSSSAASSAGSGSTSATTSKSA